MRQKWSADQRNSLWMALTVTASYITILWCANDSESVLAVPLKCLKHAALSFIWEGLCKREGGEGGLLLLAFIVCLFFRWFQFWDVACQKQPLACHYLKCRMFVLSSHYRTCSFCPTRDPSPAAIAAMNECHHGLLKQPIMFNSFEWCFITVKMIFTRESAGESLSPPITIRRSASTTLLPT